MQYLSQRDPRWANIRLGWGDTNTSTIGSHGCTITALAMLAGLTPKEVNERLIAVKGYAAHQNTPKTFNLILWSKIKEAIPWLEFEWRNYTYSGAADNKRVADAIAKNGGCLVAVDGSKIGGNTKDGHWVLYIGNQRMVDTWDGTEKPTTHYPATGFAIINKVGVPPTQGGNGMANMYGSPNQYDLSNPESMKIAVDRLNDILTGKYIKTVDHDKAIKDLTDKMNAEKARAVTEKEQYIQKELAKVLQVGEGETIADLIHMVKVLKDQPNQENGQHSNDLERLLAENGYEVVNYTIKRK